MKGLSYNPLADNRFIWAIQWIDCADPSINRNSVDPDVEFTAHLLMDSPPLTHKHLAAHDL